MPVGNPPTLAAVMAEFGGSGRLTDYVRGGPLVPDIPANAAISTTAAGLKLSQFAGAQKASGGTVSLSDHTVLAFAHPNTAASASVTMHSNGSFTWATNDGGSGSFPGEWLTGGVPSEYEVLATTTGGTAGTGTMGRWLPMSSSHTWTRVRAAAGIVSWYFTLQVRKIGTTNVLDSCTIHLYAEKERAEGNQ